MSLKPVWYLSLTHISIYFYQLGQRRNSVLLCSSRNVLLTTKLHLRFHLHEREKIMTTF